MTYSIEVTAGLFDKTICFDHESIICDDTQMMYAEIIAFNYWILDVSTTDFYRVFYCYEFADSSGDTVKFKFNRSKFVDDPSPQKIHAALISEVWTNVCHPKIQKV